MNLTCLGEKNENQLLKVLDKIAIRMAKKTGDDKEDVKRCMIFLMEQELERMETLREESRERAHDAIWGEGR
jgi:hypothetical protein